MLHKILELAAKLPSGIPDPGAHYKLVVEGRELSAAADYDAILTEVADVVYYAAKAIHYAASVASVSVDTALRLAVAKYELRARPGNPKNDNEEREACMAVYLAGSAADDPDPLSDRVEHIETRIATLAAQFARLAGASNAD